MNTMRNMAAAAAIVTISALPFQNADAWWGWGPWSGWGDGNAGFSFHMGGGFRGLGNGWYNPYYGGGYPYYGYGHPYAGGYPYYPYALTRATTPETSEQ